MAKRVGFYCSNPDCARPTVGPHSTDEKEASVGVAAHITAAAAGGPRYNADLTPIQRKALPNGIWLCATCSTLIDKDPERYPVDLLIRWKEGAERLALARMEGADHQSPIIHLDVDVSLTGKKRTHLYTRPRNEPGYTDTLICYWSLTWEYVITVYNNSEALVRNIQMRIDSPLPVEYDKFPKANNIPPMEPKQLNMTLSQNFIGTWKQADEKLLPNLPPEFLEANLIFTFVDTNDQKHEVVIPIKSLEPEWEK